MESKSIREIFSEVPVTYEMVNHIITMGLDTVWRKRLAGLATRSCGSRWLDMCSGTGDTAVLLRKLADDRTMVVAQDFSMPMLRRGVLRAESGGISFCIADAGKQSFKENTFDVATISFATRNINTGREALTRYFREFYRILKPGGTFMNLETSQPRNAAVRRLFHLYVRLSVPTIGYLISGSRAAYRYLGGTIPIFYGAEELSAILYAAGFKNVSFRYLTFGACAIHTAVK